jgi:hypothetical protein
MCTVRALCTYSCPVAIISLLNCVVLLLETLVLE